jgi:diaminopimelate decarboxylase
LRSSIEKYSALNGLAFNDGVLLWGGRKVSDIANELGSTPFYAYDSERITQRVRDLRQAMPDDLQIHYAMKANPMPEVVGHLVGLVDGLDIASAGELKVALQSGVSPAEVSFAGPGKRNAELTAAIRAGVTINMESAGELYRILETSERIGIRPNVAIRVNPEFELKSAGMKMGGGPSQFGIDASAVPAILREVRNLDLDFKGFHIFSGSQNLREGAIRESMLKTTELVLKLSEGYLDNMSFVNIGGGLGIPYFANETPINLDLVGDAAGVVVSQLKSALGDIAVIMELGRYLVGEAGIYVCQVIDIKESRGKKFAVCDGGLHHNLAASGNFGQILRKNYPIANVETSSTNKERVTVVGPLCTPLDIIGDNVELAPLEVGSLVAVLQSGAYGMTASPHGFLSQAECREVFL